MKIDHKKAISDANRGNKHSSIKNRETNKYLKDILRRLVLVQDDGSKAYRIVNALIERAEEGDLRAIEIILDRLDGKVMQQLHADVEQNYSVPIRIITGIDDDYEPRPGDIPRVTQEQADADEDFKGISVQYVPAPPRDADGKLIKTDT